MPRQLARPPHRPVNRFAVYLCQLDPTVGREIQKTRPCVVVSPDELNEALRTVIVAPMTTRVRGYPTRVPIIFAGKTGEIALDQIRTVDRERLVKRLGEVVEPESRSVLAALHEMFSW